MSHSGHGVKMRGPHEELSQRIEPVIGAEEYGSRHGCSSEIVATNRNFPAPYVAAENFGVADELGRPHSRQSGPPEH